MKYQKIIYLLFILATVSACKFNKIRKSTDLKEKYDAAIAYYEKEDYYKASLILEEIIPLIKGTKESEIAQFYYAYCQYHLNQLSLAAYYFERFYQTFRASTRVEEARYMHVKSLYEDSPPYNLDQTNTYSAISATQSFLNAYPNSRFFEECSVMIKELRVKLERKAYENARLYYKINNYRSAVISFMNFQKGFPDSDFNEEVAYLKLEAQYRYASQSTVRRKKDRLNEALDYYEYLLDNYPESKFIKPAQKIYDKCLSELKKINS
ncbi:MAG: outer membrane protein assembly factor BamD [Microscillaceae bacterium]|nr:outer membrane protein assembly factor BamD [Microscillaceae bacterium]